MSQFLEVAFFESQFSWTSQILSNCSKNKSINIFLSFESHRNRILGTWIAIWHNYIP